MRRHLILWVLLGLLALGALLSLGESSTTQNPTSGSTVVSVAPEVTARDVVSAMPARTIRKFCAAYFVVANYDKSFRAFSKGYTLTDPSAEAVFDEALTRC